MGPGPCRRLLPVSERRACFSVSASAQRCVQRFGPQRATALPAVYDAAAAPLPGRWCREGVLLVDVSTPTWMVLYTNDAFTGATGGQGAHVPVHSVRSMHTCPCSTCPLGRHPRHLSRLARQAGHSLPACCALPCGVQCAQSSPHGRLRLAPQASPAKMPLARAFGSSTACQGWGPHPSW